MRERYERDYTEDWEEMAREVGQVHLPDKVPLQEKNVSSCNVEDHRL